MKDIDSIIFERIYGAFRRHMVEKFNDNGLALEYFYSMHDNDMVKVTFVFKYYGAYKSMEIFYRKDYILQDMLYSLFKIIDSNDLNAEIREMICQVKSIQHNQK